MDDKIEKLKSLDDKKLIDVVKNYRQYGYNNQIRTGAIEILESRGIDKEQLMLTGNFESSIYDSTDRIYNTFKKNSKVAFICYGLLLVTNIVVPILAISSVGIATFVQIVNWIVLIVYFIYLIKSILNQSDFYKALGKEYGTGGALLYFIIGMPLYIVMYFYFRKQMKDEMKLIN